MDGGDSHSAVAGEDERTRMTGGLVVERKPIPGQHAQARPASHHRHAGESWEDADRAPRLAARLGGEAGGAGVGQPDLDRSQPARAQAGAMGGDAGAGGAGG